jgi:3-hydroxyacyl-[acyl-carrier-protein] dehydratase
MTHDTIGHTAGAGSAPFSYPISLDAHAIAQFIPHRDAMLFAQQVTVLAHDYYTGEATWAEDSFVFKGHFPGRAIVPGVMIIEAAAQIAGAGLRAGDPIANASAAGNIGVLMAVRKCIFRHPVTPNMKLFFELRIRQISPDVANVEGTAHNEHGLVANLEFVFAQTPVDKLLAHL